MISKNISNAPSFVLQAQLLIPIMHRRLSGDPNLKIVINKSLFAHKPLIVPIEEADANCIELEDFLAVLDTRINAEISYREEIAQLKDNICEEFNKLCDEAIDEDFIKLVRDQRQRIINTIIDETKIEQKMIAEQFYNDMMNGWDEKALNIIKFSEFVHELFWKPLLTPIPIEALYKLRGLIKGLEKEKTIDKIEVMTKKLEEHIKSYLMPTEVKINDYPQEELKSLLDELTKKRQICNVEVHDMPESENIIQEFTGKCINNVIIYMSSKEFLAGEIKTSYQELQLEEKIEENCFDQLFWKIQKQIQSLNVKLGKGNYDFIGKLLTKFKVLKCLSIDLKNNEIGAEGAKSLSSCLKELSNISILNLDIANNEIGAEGAKLLSNCLKELINISMLNLNLDNNEIGAEGVQSLSSCLKELINISMLNLNLGHNEIGVEIIKPLSSCLEELNNVTMLSLNLWFNEIGMEGTKVLCDGLKKLKYLLTLDLNLFHNQIGVEGAKSLASSLKELTNINILKLNLCNNNIEPEGAACLFDNLKELKNISILEIMLSNNNIGEEGITMMSSAFGELKNISTLDLHLRHCNIKDKSAKVLAYCLKQLKNISVLNLNLCENKIGEEGEAALILLINEHSNYKVWFQS